MPMTNTGGARHCQSRNVSDPERMASAIGGATLVAFGLSKKSWGGAALAALGGGLIYRAATAHCPMYQALGVNTRPRAKGRGASIPYELGVRVDASVTINRSREELYKFWRNLENLPRFMRHLESVKEIDNKHSHWVAKAPVGRSVQWKAEIINEAENERIGWRSLPGSDVDNAGSVRFKPAPDGNGTVVQVSLQYNPPGGVVGAMFAKLFGEEPSIQIDDDLQRFKSLMETGRVPDVEKAKTAAGDKGWRRDEVGQASEESFPASDAPSWTPVSASH